jgi:hypothetical protein
MSVKRAKKKSVVLEVEEEDFSLNDLLLRGRISAAAVEKELPSGDKLVEFRLIVSRERRDGVDTLDIGAWSAKSRLLKYQVLFTGVFGPVPVDLQAVGRLKPLRFLEFR